MSLPKNQTLKAQLMEASQLKQLMDQQVPLIIIDCRFDLQNVDSGKSAFEQAHIPTSHYLHLNEDLSSEVSSTGGRHPLPDLSTFADKLAGMGISPETRVVIYDDHRGAYATRAWWLLNHVGIYDCWIVNGGFSNWTNRCFPTESGESPARALRKAEWFSGGKLPTVNFNQLANGSLRDERLIFDAREAIRYRGEKEPIDPVAGHIPGALNAPWQDNTDDLGFFKNQEELKAIWASITTNNSITTNKMNTQSVIHYCGSGVTACVNIFSMVLAGYPTPTLYPGSWSDWCGHFDK